MPMNDLFAHVSLVALATATLLSTGCATRETLSYPCPGFEDAMARPQSGTLRVSTLEGASHELPILPPPMEWNARAGGLFTISEVVDPESANAYGYPEPELVEGMDVELTYGFGVSLYMWEDDTNAASTVSFRLPEDLRDLEAGSTTVYAVDPGGVDYRQDVGQVCRWAGGAQSVYGDAAPAPGDMTVEVLEMTGSERPWPELVTDDFVSRIRISYTAPAPLVGYEQIEGELVPCADRIETLSFEVEFEITAEHFAYDGDRVCTLDPMG